MRRWLAAAAALVVWLMPCWAAAHASLVRSDPPQAASLEAAPGRVRLWFAEPIEPTFSIAQVLDADGKRVDTGLRPAAEDARRLDLLLPALPAGIYTALWRVVSTDGHAVKGSVVFSVGSPLAPTAAAAAHQDGEWPSYALVLLRWLHLLGCATLAGSSAFVVWILPAGERALRRVGAPAAEDSRAYRRLAASVRITLAIALFAAVGHLAARSVDMGQATPGLNLPLLLNTVMLSTNFGRMWLAGYVLMAALGGLLGWGLYWRGWRQWLALAAGALLLLTWTLSGHAAANSRAAVAIVSDWVHGAAAATWVGGLVLLLLVLPALLSGLAPAQRGEVLRAVISRFSLVAAVSVAALLVTGGVSVWLLIGSGQGLAETAYGQSLFLKLALLLPLFSLGLCNLTANWSRLQRLRQAAWAARTLQWLQRRFTRLLAGEIGLGLSVFAVVALLTSVAPPAQSYKPLVGVGAAGGVQVVVRASPGLVGANRYEVNLTGADGGPPAGVGLVRLRLTPRDRDQSGLTVETERVGPGRYQASGAELSVQGRWRVEVVVRREEQEDALVAFDWDVQRRPSRRG